MPVREIARLCGVTERTILKYAAKHNWKPRYRWQAGKAGARHRRWQPNPEFALAKGAGGRFIKREDAGKAFPVGLKATDPEALARASADCVRAQAIVDEAQLSVARERRGEARINAIAVLAAALAEIVAWRGEQDKAADRARRANADTHVESDAVEWRHGMMFVAPQQRARRYDSAQKSHAPSGRSDPVERALWVTVAAALTRWEGHLGAG